MEQFSIKWKFVLLPYLRIFVLYLFGYSFLHWYFIVRPWLDVEESFPRVIVPIGLSWIPLLVWWRRRLKVFQFRKENGALLLILVASVAMGISTAMAQRFMLAATGKLTVLNTMEDQRKYPTTRYYQLQQFFIDQQHIGKSRSYTVSGKYNTNYNMHLSVVMPIYSKSADTIKEASSFFVGVDYKETISNKLSRTEKAGAFDAFEARVLKEFYTTDYNKLTYLELMGNNEERELSEEAIRSCKVIRYQEPVFFFPRFGNFSQHTKESLQSALIALAIALAFVFMIIMFTPVKPEANDLIEGFQNIN